MAASQSPQEQVQELTRLLWASDAANYVLLRWLLRARGLDPDRVYLAHDRDEGDGYYFCTIATPQSEAFELSFPNRVEAGSPELNPAIIIGNDIYWENVARRWYTEDDLIAAALVLAARAGD
jgi:hypothetical protein